MSAKQMRLNVSKSITIVVVTLVGTQETKKKNEKEALLYYHR